jgi:hypothetical protein
VKAKVVDSKSVAEINPDIFFLVFI